MDFITGSAFAGCCIGLMELVAILTDNKGGAVGLLALMIWQFCMIMIYQGTL